MRIISKSNLVAFWQQPQHAKSRTSLENWVSIVKAASWTCMNDVVRSAPGDPDPIGPDRVVFNIHGNSYRLIVRIDFTRQVVGIKFLGTHADYDAVDVRAVSIY